MRQIQGRKSECRKQIESEILKSHNQRMRKKFINLHRIMDKLGNIISCPYDTNENTHWIFNDLASI